jgi:hypothetical protein
VPESLEILRMVECGYLHLGDIAVVLGVSRQRADQLRHREDLPSSMEMAGRRLWRRSDVDRGQSQAMACPMLEDLLNSGPGSARSLRVLGREDP